MSIPEFVLTLRSQIGHGRLWLPGVSGVIRNDVGQILLVRRTDTRMWTLVSGVLEPGEQPAIGLAREVAEETGVVIEVETLAAVRSYPPVHYPNGDVAQYMNLTFLCRHVAGTARVADDESTEVGWFYQDCLPPDTSPRSLDRLALAFAYLADPASGPKFDRD